MADVVLAPQRINAGGIAPARTGGLTTNDTYLVRNNGAVILLFEKTGAGACVVTVQTPARAGGLDVAERTFTVPATTGDVAAGPFPPSIYNDGSGDLRFTLSEVTGLTVAALML
ncbi:MAG: hypothetical protein ACE5GS_15150 [Kiloniellaceae bacterium]